MYISPINTNKTFLHKNNKPTFNGKFPNGSIKPKHIKEFVAYQDFARYNPLRVNFGDYTIPIHNEEIAKRLKPKYT